VAGAEDAFLSVSHVPRALACLCQARRLRAPGKPGSGRAASGCTSGSGRAASGACPTTSGRAAVGIGSQACGQLRIPLSSARISPESLHLRISYLAGFGVKVGCGGSFPFFFRFVG
jgi:hypothetical protein